MAYTSKLFYVLLISILASSSITISARKLNSKSSLLARLKLDKDEPTSCWDSLFELQSCTGEVVLFFMNGETHLGTNCCKAISIIEHQCWPSMMGSLGITTEESNILRGYCDATVGDDGSSTAPPPTPANSHA
ncbi:hypothetical protein ACJIZ3_007203 [Penstemon smallii]|uniref:Prolamin-like domain-containing protein n=1 Tax=Penstemon smallii TaxID=265156 RepID=A0ABD3SA52_9LAMI